MKKTHLHWTYMIRFMNICTYRTDKNADHEWFVMSDMISPQWVICYISNEIKLDADIEHILYMIYAYI